MAHCRSWYRNPKLLFSRLSIVTVRVKPQRKSPADHAISGAGFAPGFCFGVPPPGGKVPAALQGREPSKGTSRLRPRCVWKNSKEILQGQAPFSQSQHVAVPTSSSLQLSSRLGGPTSSIFQLTSRLGGPTSIAFSLSSRGGPCIKLLSDERAGMFPSSSNFHACGPLWARPWSAIARVDTHPPTPSSLQSCQIQSTLHQ